MESEPQIANMEIDLSVVIPAYNEELRLPYTLIQVLDFLDVRKESYEIIVVDDGSKDETAKVVHQFEKIHQHLRLIQQPKNGGKGLAVKTGMLSAKGKRVLFMDADGATPVPELVKLEKVLNDGAQVAFASRALIAEDSVVNTVWYRKLFGRVFNACVNNLVLPGVKDTQCGFKLFTNSAAQFIFSRQKLNGFCFDVEILHIAHRAKIKMAEVPVNWTNIPGSKVKLGSDSAKMFFDLLRIVMMHRAVPNFQGNGE